MTLPTVSLVFFYFPRYNDKQLFAMIHEHLIMSGCFKTAESLRNEIEITPLVDPGQFRSGHVMILNFS